MQLAGINVSDMRVRVETRDDGLFRVFADALLYAEQTDKSVLEPAGYDIVVGRLRDVFDTKEPDRDTINAIRTTFASGVSPITVLCDLGLLDL